MQITNKITAAKHKPIRFSKEANENFSKLPEFCYCYHPVTNKPIRVFRGESGYYPPVYEDVWVEEINGLLGITKEQEEAMLSGSIFGWECAAANPDSWKNDEKWQAQQKAKGRI